MAVSTVSPLRSPLKVSDEEVLQGPSSKVSVLTSCIQRYISLSSPHEENRIFEIASFFFSGRGIADFLTEILNCYMIVAR